ncbi:MAG TPA: YbhN family protein [Gemmatimonadaceae bacterium]|nr:YbhN family protein [Gemmatimonadaceae bacterium]
MCIAFPSRSRRPTSTAAGPPIDARLSRTGSVALRLALVALAAWALRRELAGVHPGELLRHFAGYGWRHAALALGGTAASFATLGVLERLAIRYASRRARVPGGAALATSFVAHAFSQSVGLALLTGAAVRLRAYARFRLDAAAVARVSAFVTLSVTLGLLACGAVALLGTSQPLRVAGASLPGRPIGLALALLAAAYLAWSVIATRDVVGRGRWRLRRPNPRVAFAQLALAAVDWLLTGTVLFALLPAGSGVGYGELLRAYLVAQTAGMASHIPGAAGVLELAVLALVATGNEARRAPVIAALVMFRVVYYLLPLLLAMAVAAIGELARRRARMRMPALVPAVAIPVRRVG